MDATLFRAALAAGEPLVLDGGLATQLEAQGADLSDRLWSARLLIEAPEAITAAHLAFYRAGARIATTASYQATFEGFAARGIDRAAAETLLRRSVDLAVEARRAFLDGTGRSREPGANAQPGTMAPLFVAASIGPYGAMLADGSEYRGRYGRSLAELREFHRARLDVLAATPADVLAVETIPELEEVEAVAGLLAERPDAAAWISVTCADGARLRSGVPVEEAVEAASAPGVIGFGVNCTAPAFVEEIVTRVRAVTAMPVIVYPNSGEGWDAAARRWTGAASERVDAAAASRWRAAGASIVGGCCRVTPDQVAALAAAR